MVENTLQIYVITLCDVQQHHQKNLHGSVSVTVTQNFKAVKLISFSHQFTFFFLYSFQRFFLWIAYKVPGSGPGILRVAINRAVLAVLELEIEE